MTQEPRNKIAVIDDEKNIGLVLTAILEKSGFEVETFSDPGEALRKLESQIREKGEFDYSVVITDLNMPKLSGLEILENIKARNPHLPVVMITAFATVEVAVQAMKAGAFDFISKPFDQAEILSVVSKALNTYRLTLREPQGSGAEELVQRSLLDGTSPAMVEVMRIIQKVAPSPSTVLITGESGTGKELVALEIHRNSDRSEKSFIKMNCAAIPHNLIESELFGHEKGAFTGAFSQKPGRFELADGGTLFLDEVADMPVEMQVKLLRVLQESEFERVGGIETVAVNVRILAATNKKIEDEIAAGRFREDLYYRLNVVPIQLPPLRERRSDIEDLVYFFVRKFNDRLRKNVEAVSTDCLERLITYPWPGNIRQLENVLERAVLMSDTNILRVQDLPREISEIESSPLTVEEQEHMRLYQDGERLKDIIKRQTEAVERQIIERALEQNNGNITKTAERLGLSRKGLQLKLKDLGIAAK